MKFFLTLTIFSLILYSVKKLLIFLIFLEYNNFFEIILVIQLNQYSCDICLWIFPFFYLFGFFFDRFLYLFLVFSPKTSILWIQYFAAFCISFVMIFAPCLFQYFFLLSKNNAFFSLFFFPFCHVSISIFSVFSFYIFF